MCIRDSKYTLTLVLAFILTGGSINGQIEFSTGSSYKYLKGCLLYTSDAADERSSVDLGGRRIIKKKKTESIHSRHYIYTDYKPREEKQTYITS